MYSGLKKKQQVFEILCDKDLLSRMVSLVFQPHPGLYVFIKGGFYMSYRKAFGKGWLLIRWYNSHGPGSLKDIGTVPSEMNGFVSDTGYVASHGYVEASEGTIL